jgi:hypothetical protein
MGAEAVLESASPNPQRATVNGRVAVWLAPPLLS